MALAVCAGAMLQCSFGAAPSSLMVLPINQVMGNTPLANIMDQKPMVNILGFGVCNQVPSMPRPCTFVPAGSWLPGSPKVLIKNAPALNQSCKLMCGVGGVISILNPGQNSIQVP